MIQKERIFSQDRIVGSLFFSAVSVTLLVTLTIIFFLGREAWKFFLSVSLGDFLFGIEWSPLIEPLSFGVLPLLAGTLQITLSASLIALPLGLASAVYLSEYASKKTRGWMKPLLDVLAGIPSVVYGFFAVSILTPALQKIIPDLEFFNSLSAGIVVGVMILPLVTSLAEEALRALPNELRRGAEALGASKVQIVKGILVPAAASGIMAAFIIGISRAIGETMAVTLAAGATPRLTWSPLVGIQTLTAYIAQVSLGDTPYDSLEFESMFAVAALLFILTFSLNVFARKIIRKVKLKHG